MKQGKFLDENLKIAPHLRRFFCVLKIDVNHIYRFTDVEIFHSERCDAIIFVMAHVKQKGQVTLNYVSNAIKIFLQPVKA